MGSVDEKKKDELAEKRKVNAESSDKFVRWIQGNCKDAVSHTEGRRILSHIKKPIRKLIGK